MSSNDEVPLQPRPEDAARLEPAAINATRALLAAFAGVIAVAAIAIAYQVVNLGPIDFFWEFIVPIIVILIGLLLAQNLTQQVAIRMAQRRRSGEVRPAVPVIYAVLVSAVLIAAVVLVPKGTWLITLVLGAVWGLLLFLAVPLQLRVLHRYAEIGDPRFEQIADSLHAQGSGEILRGGSVAGLLLLSLPELVYGPALAVAAAFDPTYALPGLLMYAIAAYFVARALPEYGPTGSVKTIAWLPALVATGVALWAVLAR